VKPKTIRVVGGAWRNRRLATLEGSRPTSERAREALFDILGPAVEGRTVLDVCAGSGAVAIEALSRGAASATAVERDTSALELNRRALAVDLEVVRGDAGRAISRLAREGRRFDIVFADPPYRAGADVPTAELARVLAPGGMLIRQHDAGTNPECGPLRVLRRTEYGRNVFTFLRAETEG